MGECFPLLNPGGLWVALISAFDTIVSERRGPKDGTRRWSFGEKTAKPPVSLQAEKTPPEGPGTVAGGSPPPLAEVHGAASFRKAG